MACCRPWWRARPSQSRSGQRSGSTKSSRHRARPGPRTRSRSGPAGASGPAGPAGRARRRPSSRSRGGCRCRRAGAGAGSTPEWAMTGRVPSLRSSTDLIARSSRVRFQVGRAWAARPRATSRRRRRASADGVGVDVDGHGLVVPAPHEHRRVVGQQVDGLAGLAAGLGPHRRGCSPTAGAGPATAAGRPRRRPRTARAGRCGRGGAGSRGRRRRPGPRRRPCSSGVASARAMRVGPWLAPLRNSRSPLTWSTQSRSSTVRRPVWRAARSLARPSSVRTSTSTS